VIFHRHNCYRSWAPRISVFTKLKNFIFKTQETQKIRSQIEIFFVCLESTFFGYLKLLQIIQRNTTGEKNSEHFETDICHTWAMFFKKKKKNRLTRDGSQNIALDLSHYTLMWFLTVQN
jgi:hypothetical protein